MEIDIFYKYLDFSSGICRRTQVNLSVPIFDLVTQFRLVARGPLLADSRSLASLSERQLWRKRALKLDNISGDLLP